jgi:hypothetical protein
MGFYHEKDLLFLNLLLTVLVEIECRTSDGVPVLSLYQRSFAGFHTLTVSASCHHQASLQESYMEESHFRCSYAKSVIAN